MKKPSVTPVVSGLSPQGQKLLRVLLGVIRSPKFQLGDPSTYIGYKECCDRLGLLVPAMDVPWGRLLQQCGLNDLNEWTKCHRLPAISGLIVNISGDRAWYPGGDYFNSHGRRDPDFVWWNDEITKSAGFNWGQFV